VSPIRPSRPVVSKAESAKYFEVLAGKINKCHEYFISNYFKENSQMFFIFEIYETEARDSGQAACTWGLRA
jgi:hypothetical protein